MPSKIEEAYIILAVHKAKRMADKTTYANYIDEVIREFDITDINKAFLLGSIDGMLYELASTIGQAYMKPNLRKRVLSNIMDAVEF